MHIETKKCHEPGVHKKTDDRRRLREISTTFLETCNEFQPHIVAFEDFPFVRNASASVKIALGWGSCFTLATHVLRAAVLVFAPQEIKMVVTGNPEAEKIDLICAVHAQFPTAHICAGADPEDLVKKEVDEISHVADAVGAALAASKSGKVRLAIQEWRRAAGLNDDDFRKVIAQAEKPARRW